VFKAGLAKFGPWGGDEGRRHDIIVAPHCLESMTISGGLVINSLTFSYIDRNGQYHTSGRWGGPGGTSNTVPVLKSIFSQFSSCVLVSCTCRDFEKT
jgi:hypothetical protein